MVDFVECASEILISSFLRDEKLEVRLSPLHADGVVARELIRLGDIVYSEKPLCFLQTVPNSQDVIVCGQCQSVLGELDVQAGVLSKSLSRIDINARESSCQCQAKCGVLYCSVKCSQKHWLKGHRLLCTGHITEEDVASSPLIKFKMHACATNEIFLLVADVFANICCEIEKMREESSLDDESTLVAALFPYSTFVRNPWWEVAIPSRDIMVTDPEESPVKFAMTLKQLVCESWNMLREVLDLDSRGLTEVLSSDYFARTIGMFEQNNIGVRCDHPLATAAYALAPYSEHVTPLLSAAEMISQYLEGQEECEENWVDDDDDSDNDNEDDEENDGGGLQDMDECGHDHDHGHGHCHNHEEMDDGETGDSSLDKLNTILREYGVDSIFPPLDGTALYSMMCKINHSCSPNVRVTYLFTKEHGLVASLIATREIQPDEELLQSYIDQTMGTCALLALAHVFLSHHLLTVGRYFYLHTDTAARQAALADYGFRCTCYKCSI